MIYDVCMIAEVVCRLLWSVWYVALQLNARATASLTLIDKSCPAGFEIVEGIIPKRYSCQCSKADLNIQSCNETTEDVLLKVRVLWVWCGVLINNHLFCRIPHCRHFISSISFSLMFPTTSTLMCPHSLSSHAGLAMEHSHHQLRRQQVPVHYTLFPWLLPLPAVVHRQWGRVQVHCVSGLGPEGPAVHLQQTRWDVK